MARSAEYTDEDIKAIIGRALEGQAGGKGGATHADLLAIGEQVGISPGDIERAAHEVLESRLDAEAGRRVVSSRKRWLGAHAVLFAVVNALLFTVNALTTPGEWWVLFSVVFWGLALALHTGAALGLGVSTGRRQRERARLEAEKVARARRPVRVDERAALPRVDADAIEEELLTTEQAPRTEKSTPGG